MNKVFFAIVFIIACHITDASTILPPTEKNFTRRISGGFETNITSVPYQASLIISDTYLCGGSIISPQWILTAAHCTYSVHASDVQIRVGSSYWDRGGEVMKTDLNVPHSNYNPISSDYDYALLKLSQRIFESASKRVVKLIDADTTVAKGACGLVSGWGNTENARTPYILRAAYVSVIDHKRCAGDFIRQGFKITDRMMCAYSTGGLRAACKGDSGGPLVVNGTLVGVVSIGEEICGKSSFAGIYADVSKVRSWITQQTGV